MTWLKKLFFLVFAQNNKALQFPTFQFTIWCSNISSTNFTKNVKTWLRWHMHLKSRQKCNQKYFKKWSFNSCINSTILIFCSAQNIEKKCIFKKKRVLLWSTQKKWKSFDFEKIWFAVIWAPDGTMWRNVTNNKFCIFLLYSP